MHQQKLKKIYFIEDSSDEIFLSRMLFRHHKIKLEIEHLRNMDDFFERLRGMGEAEANEAIVVVDLNLTLTKGTEGIRRLRHLEGGTKLIAGICTGSEDPADERNSFEAGADFFVAKPLDKNSLKHICNSVSTLKMIHIEPGEVEIIKESA